MQPNKYAFVNIWKKDTQLTVDRTKGITMIFFNPIWKGEGDNRGWDGWMASPTQWTWVWVISGSWWWTWRPAMLQSMGLQRVGYDWVTELNWIVNGCWILSKAFSASIEIIIRFLSSFVNMMYHMDQFAYIEESLYPWNKCNLLMVYEFLDVLLNSVC